MTGLRESDQRLVTRYVDGELPPEQRATFERRLLAEQTLRDAVEDQRGVRACFTVPGPLEVAPAGLSTRVLESVRRLPSRDELLAEASLDEARAEADVLHMGRKVLVAAVLIFGLSMLVRGGVIRRPDPVLLEAADDKMIEQIDAQIEATDALRRDRRSRR